MMEGFQKQWSSGGQRVTLDSALSGLNALDALTFLCTNAGPMQGCLWPMAATRTFV